MKIKRILEAQQTDMRKQKQQHSKKKSKRDSEYLSFSDILNLMKHSSYKRGKGGAIKQVR